MLLLLFFLSYSAFAGTDSKNAFGKSYARDNTFCGHHENRIEILIRGLSKFTEPNERGYGEYLFYRKEDEKPVLMPLNASRSDTYKLFLGTSPLCSKSHGYQIDPKTFAVLLLKENRPFEDKLVIQFFDSKTLTPKDFIETDWPTDKAQKSKNGFAFRTLQEKHDPENGKVTIEGDSFFYYEKDFPIWINYSSKGFEMNTGLTFKKFPAKVFKDEKDFLMITGWDSTEKKFTKDTLFMAESQKVKKRCYLFIEKKQKLTGNVAWRCQSI